MAKTESTAVNSLIELVQTNQAKPVIDPSDDLFAPPKRPTPAKASQAAPRMSGSIPPLPRSRAPGGTSQLTLPEHMPAVRSTTAPPSRGTTIPPIPSVVKNPPGRPGPIADGTPPPAIQARPAAPRPSASALPPPARPSPAPRAAAPSPSAGTKTPKRASSPSPAQLYAKGKTGPLDAIQQSRIDMTGDMVRGEEWFEASRAVEKFEDETYVGTSPHVLHDRRAEASLVKKLILPGLGFIVVGALIGAFIAFNSSGKKPAVVKPPAARVTPVNQPTTQNAALAAEIAHGNNTGVPAASAPTAPTTEHVAAAVPAETADTHVVQTTRGVVRLADVRIDSMPAGATVTLVEKTATGEKKSFLGTTPIATSVDPSHTYEVVLALQGHPEQTAKLDPAHAPHLQISLGKAGRTAPAQPAVAKATPAVAKPAVAKAAVAKAAPKHHSAPKTDQLADPGFDSAPAPAETPAAPAEKPEKPAAAAGANGTLMISSKPPCEILIDGKSTGLTTPQRAISLAAGAHKVTLVNSGASINKTLMVQINPDQSTKLVKDLTGN